MNAYIFDKPHLLLPKMYVILFETYVTRLKTMLRLISIKRKG